MTATAPRSGGYRTQLILLAVVAVVSWSLAIVLRIEPLRASLLGRLGLGGTVPSAESPERASAAQGSAAAAPAPSGSAAGGVGSSSPSAAAGQAASAGSAAVGSAASTGSAATSAAADAPAGPLDPVTACVASLLPAGAFERGRPNVAFVCEERYPRKAVTRLQAQISLGQWGTEKSTEAMREWAMLGWYELAALSIFRGYCCKDAPTLLWTFRLLCPLDKAMGRMESAVARGDNRGLQVALAEYTYGAQCLTKKGQAANFGQSELPGPGIASLRKIIDRRKKGKPKL